MASLHPGHHPADELLVGYAAGNIAEAPALMIATHLALCPACRRQVADYEALGGELLSELSEEPLGADSLGKTLAELNRVAPEPGRPSSASPPKSDSPLLPQPLRDYMSQAWAARGTWRSACRACGP